ncbi:fibronectin type III domain-containing protein [Blastococcus litoris]|uniref:fibronectin type III domain-containing protein n=1 Tax=Blastococcus litoris TaxID=2171622 RepID=UPI000E303202|nr:fibronectin type III domain-containing protein [Blastococcus litoris]
MNRLVPLSALSLTAALISLAAPPVATAAPPPPAATPPAFALSPVSGTFPGEDGYVEGKVLDLSADGQLVLYKTYVNTPERYFQPVLLVHDRGTGANQVVDSAPGQPGTPGAWSGVDAAALSADGSTVVWTTRDDVLAEPSDVSGEAFRTDLATGTTTRVPRSAEAGIAEATAVDVSADGRRAAVLIGDPWSSEPGRVEIVDLSAGTVTAAREVTAPHQEIELSDDGSTVAWVHDVEGPLDEWENPTWDSVLVVADAGTLKPVASLADHVADAPSLDASGSQVAYVGPEGALLVADLTAQDAPRRTVPTAGSGEVHRPRLSGDGSTVVYDERMYDEGSLPSAAWSVDLATGTAALVAGRSEGSSDGEGDDSEGDGSEGDDGEEPTSVLGETAYHPVPSHDGTVVATWLDTKIVAAVATGDAPDTIAPVWPADARLTAEPLDRTHVRLSWPAATDDRQIRGYEISADGVVLTTVPADRLTHDVALHADDTAAYVVEYGVRAVDTSGNATPALTARARNSAGIEVVRPRHDALQVTWEASADAGLTGYRVLRAAGGQQAGGSLGSTSGWVHLADVPAGTTELLDDDLPALTWFDYRVDLVLDDGSTRPWATRTSGLTDLPAPSAPTVDDVRATSVRVAWPALPASTPLDHYRVEYRQTSPVPQAGWTQVDTVDPSEERLTTVTGLAPRTTYAVRAVAVLRHGWAERPATTEPTTTTASEGVTMLDVQAPRTADGGALVLGSDLTATATGEPGLDAELRLWTSSSPSGEPQVVVPMTEGPAGTYAIEPYRLDGSLAAVGRAEVVLTDGTRRLTRAVTVAPVSGRLDLAIAASPDDLGALTLRLVGSRGTQEQAVTAPGTVSVPLTPGTWSVQLVAADGEIVARRSLLSVAAATVVPLELTPVRAAQLDVSLTAPTGSSLLPGTLTVRNAQGEVLATRRMGPAAPTANIQQLPGHSRLALDYRFDDQTARVVQPRTEVATGAGRTAVALALEPLAAATSDVAVTGAGRPVGSAAVKLVQVADGRTFTTTATTGPDGAAVLTALAGPGTLSATADFHVAAAKPVELTADRRGAFTLDLPRTPTYRIRPHLIVVGTDGNRVEQPLDWRTAVHFGASLRAGTGSTTTGLTMSQDVAYAGAPGHRVELCVDGREAHLPRGCADVVLGDDRDVDVTVVLEQAGAATADLVDESGNPVGNWSATIYRSVTGGRAQFVGTRTGQGSSPVLGFGAEGLHTITWSDGTGRRATSDVVVDAGGTTDLGTVVLSAAAAAPADASVQALPDPVMPGGLLVVRVALPASDTARSQLRVRLPDGASAENGTATIDGSRTASTVGDGTVVVPMTGRGATTVRVPLTVGTDVLDGQLSAPVTLRMADGAVLDLPPLAAQVRRVSLEGPTETAGPFTVRGRAPAGTPVAVRDEAGTVLAEATAGAGGRWSARVDLPSPLEGTTYRLVAVTTAPTPDGTVELLSEPLAVRFTTSGVEPVSLTIDNSLADARGRAVTWDPRTGNASPTLVYVLRAPIVLTARFEDASRVRGFTGYIGSLAVDGTCTATECTATFPPAGPTDVGDIAVGYTVDALPTANGSAPVPTLEELVSTVAHPFNAPEDADFQVSGPDEFAGRWTVQGQVFQARSTVGAARDLAPMTDAELAFAERVGAPVRNVEVTKRGEGEDTELVISADVSASWLDGGAAGVAAAADEPKWKPVEKAVKVGLAFYDLYEIAQNGADNKILDGLQEHVDLNIRACQPEIADELTAYIDDAKGTLVMHKLALNAFDWMSVAGGSWAAAMGETNPRTASFINSTVKKIIATGVNALGDDFVERAVERVEAQGLKSCDPRVKYIPRDHDWDARPMGSPTWIFDPSGYVYEALGTQRLEGVTATVLSGPSPDGPWTVWDAEAFGQTNPQSTSVEGTYGWDVPQGWWKVRYEKEGYRTAESQPLQVLPEHYGVDVDLHRLAAPALTGVTATADGAVEVVFDQWMSSDSVRAALGVRAGSQPVPGTVTAVGEQRSPADVALARTFRFVPTAPFGSGQVLTVTVPGGVVDHGGVPLGADAVRTVTAPTRPGGEPSCGTVKVAVSPGGQVAKGTTVTVTVTAPAGASLELRALNAPSVVDWLRAVLTGKADDARPWKVVATGKAGSDGRATFTYKATADTLLHARQSGCRSLSGVAVVDVR